MTIFNTGRDIEYDLRNDLFVHLTHLGADFYDKHKVGDLMSRLVNDLTAVRMMVGMGVVTFRRRARHSSPSRSSSCSTSTCD